MAALHPNSLLNVLQQQNSGVQPGPTYVSSTAMWAPASTQQHTLPNGQQATISVVDWTDPNALYGLYQDPFATVYRPRNVFYQSVINAVTEIVREEGITVQLQESRDFESFDMEVVLVMKRGKHRMELDFGMLAELFTADTLAEFDQFVRVQVSFMEGESPSEVRKRMHIQHQQMLDMGVANQLVDSANVISGSGNSLGAALYSAGSNGTATTIANSGPGSGTTWVTGIGTTTKVIGNVVSGLVKRMKR